MKHGRKLLAPLLALILLLALALPAAADYPARTEAMDLSEDWTGKTKATAEVTAGTESDGCRYRCVVSNAAGSTESGEATLTAK